MSEKCGTIISGSGIMRKTFIIICILAIALFSLAGCAKKEETGEFKIVTSFYPMYIIALNLTDGAQNVSLENMTDTNVGCLHDYTLKTSDLVKLEGADVFIMNGLGIETFADKVLQTNNKVSLIEASKNITNFIQDLDETNAHVWLDIDNYIIQVEEVAEGLKKSNPENASVYEENKIKYVETLNNLKTELEGNKSAEVQEAISFSDSLSYLENTMNLKLLTIENDHEQSSLSAEKLKDVIDYAKQNNIGKVIVDNQTSDKNANTLASEIGAKVYVLDSFLSGPMQKDAYEIMMRQNAKLMEE